MCFDDLFSWVHALLTNGAVDPRAAHANFAIAARARASTLSSNYSNSVTQFYEAKRKKF